MGDLFFTHQIPQGILKFHRLDKKVMLRVKALSIHRALKIKG
jgi:hypothetical protein